MILEDPKLGKIIEVVMDPDPGFSTIIFLRNVPGRPTIGQVKRINRGKRFHLVHSQQGQTPGDRPETMTDKSYTVLVTDGMGLIIPELVQLIIGLSRQLRTVIVFIGTGLADERLVEATRREVL